MQVILGSNGVIGQELDKELHQRKLPVRLVSRNPHRFDLSDQLYSADLLNYDQTLNALEGAEVAYLTAGLTYSLAIWKQHWPRIMHNVIESCKRQGTKLVFFDNVYAYGQVNGWMTEDTPLQPSSKKGAVRAELDQLLIREFSRGDLKTLIARSADFYGPDCPNGFANILVFENFRKGKKAQWLINDQVRHSYTYTPDAGKATALLGNTEWAYGQVWHLPTDKQALTGKQFIELAARELKVEPRYIILSGWMLKLTGLFNSNIREIHEMLYQNDSDYLFDSSKFDQAFVFEKTSYARGIANIASTFKNSLNKPA